MSGIPGGCSLFAFDLDAEPVQICGAGAWLVHLRKEKGLSQDELSELTGVPQSTWAYWEKTGKLAGRETIIKTAKALGVTVETLLSVKE